MPYIIGAVVLFILAAAVYTLVQRFFWYIVCAIVLLLLLLVAIFIIKRRRLSEVPSVEMLDLKQDIPEAKPTVLHQEARRGSDKENIVVIKSEDSRIWDLGEKYYQLTRLNKKCNDGSVRLDNLALCAKYDKVEFTYDSETDGYIAWHNGREIGELPRSANDFCGVASVERLHGAIENIDPLFPKKVQVRIWFK